MPRQDGTSGQGTTTGKAWRTYSGRAALSFLPHASDGNKGPILIDGYNLDTRYLQEEIYTVGDSAADGFGTKRPSGQTTAKYVVTPWVSLVGVKWVVVKYSNVKFVGKVYLQWSTSIDEELPGVFETDSAWGNGNNGKDEASLENTLFATMKAGTTASRLYAPEFADATDSAWGTHVRLYTTDNASGDITTEEGKSLTAGGTFITFHLARYKNTLNPQNINYQFGQSQKERKERGE